MYIRLVTLLTPLFGQDVKSFRRLQAGEHSHVLTIAVERWLGRYELQPDNCNRYVERARTGAIDDERARIRRSPSASTSAFDPTTRLHNLPSKRRIRTINRIVPIPPLGQYPQFLLYGHLGTAPINKRMRITTKMVPILDLHF